jgi:hypothetical protein
MGPVFRFRKRRWFDRFIHAADDLRVPGLTKLWAGYDCMCGRPTCATTYRVTARGAFVVGTAKPRNPTPPDERPEPTEDDEEVIAGFPLDEDMILPGERPKR